MGGTGGGLVYNVEELRTIVSRGPVGQPGRPGAGRGVGPRLGGTGAGGRPRRQEPDDHRLLHREHRRHGGPHRRFVLRRPDADHRPRSCRRSFRTTRTKIVEAIQVIGGTNIQFAHDPERAGSWSSKSTRAPPARPRWPPRRPASRSPSSRPSWPAACPWTTSPTGAAARWSGYAPWGNYVVIKFARWAFEKFRDAKDVLGTQMRAVGEVMSIATTYKEAVQKSIRGLESGRYGLGFAKRLPPARSLDDLLEMLAEPTSERQFIMYEALRKGADAPRSCRERTHIKAWFIEQMRELVELEEEILAFRGAAPARRAAGPGPRRTASPTATWPSSWAWPKGRSVTGAWLWESRRTTRPCRSAGSRTPPTTTRPSTPPTRCRSATAARSWSWGAVPTGSARGSSSTTAASTPPSPCARPASRRSWSTATRRRSRPTTTPPTSSTSSR